MDRNTMNAILCTIAESGEMGAPEGVMYAALMSRGITLDQLASALTFFESKGLIERSNHCAIAKPMLLEALGRAKAKAHA